MSAVTSLKHSVATPEPTKIESSQPEIPPPDRHQIKAAALNRLLLSIDWQRLAGSGRFTLQQEDLVPSEHLQRFGDGWRSGPESGYHEATCLLPRGWIQLSIRVTRLDRLRMEREIAEISADFGLGYHHSVPLERITWCGKLDEPEFFVYLPKPTIGLRFRPLGGSAAYRIDAFTAVPVSTWRAFRLAAVRKWQLVRKSHGIRRGLRKGLQLLLTGHWLGFWRKLFQALPDSVPTRIRPGIENGLQTTLNHKVLPQAERDRLEAEIAALVDPIVLSVLLPVDAVPDAILQQVIESIRQQVYPHWQLVVHLSQRTPYPHELLEGYADIDRRIRVVPALQEDDPSAVWEDLLDVIETPQVAVLDAGFALAETALYRLAGQLRRNPQADFLANRRAPLAGEDPALPPADSRLFRTEGSAQHVNVFAVADLRSCPGILHQNSGLPLGTELARQLIERGRRANYLAETLTYPCTTIHRVRVSEKYQSEPVADSTNQPWVITGDIRGISGWDRLVFEITRGCHAVGIDVRLNADSTIVRELLPPYMQPLIRRKQPNDRELTIASPCFLWHHRPTPGNVIFTMWEADQLETAWVEVLNRAAQVITASPWGADCLRAAGVTVPVTWVPLGHDPLIYHPNDTFPEVCTFGMAAALWGGGLRKNAQRLIELFQRAFPVELDVRFRIKLTPQCEFPECSDPRVEILRSYLTPEVLAEWYRSLTVFVNGSYSEGFGLHLLEAMACGRAVLTTPSSGVTSYFDDEVGYPLDYHPIPIPKNDLYRGQWAEPDAAAIVDAMRAVYKNPAEAHRRGMVAAMRARRFTWKDTGRKLRAAIEGMR